MPSVDASPPTATLLGVPAFPALGASAFDTIVDRVPRLDIDGVPLFVTPKTVAAIAKVKAKQRPTEPTIKIDLDAPPLTDIEQARAEAYARRKAERAEAFAQMRSEQRNSEAKLKSVGTDPRMKAQQAHDTIVDQPLPKWQTFDDLGIAPKPVTKRAQKLVVSTYRLLGFGILSLIVAVLLGYIGTTAFYFVNKTWVTPVALSANDEKVVGLQGQLAGLLNERAKLVAELEDAERAIGAEQQFQTQFAKAIKKDLEGRRVALGRVRQLAQTAAVTRNEIRATNDEYSEAAASKMDDEFKARLIDRNAVLAGKYQLAQITSAKLSLAERQAEFEQRAAELSTQTQSLDAILSDKSASAALSYEVLKIARDYETSKLVVAREMSNRERLKASLARQDQIIEGVSQSAYLRAVANNANVALVPYSNLKNVGKGTPLYACRFNMLLCNEVGKVRDVLPGEVQVKHPNRDTILRGRMIELQMTTAEAAQNEVLFAGSAPLGI